MLDDSFLKEIEEYNVDDIDKDFNINFNKNLNILSSINNILNFDNNTPNKSSRNINDIKPIKSDKLRPLDHNINTNNNLKNTQKIDNNQHQKAINKIRQSLNIGNTNDTFRSSFYSTKDEINPTQIQKSNSTSSFLPAIKTS